MVILVHFRVVILRKATSILHADGMENFFVDFFQASKKTVGKPLVNQFFQKKKPASEKKQNISHNGSTRPWFEISTGFSGVSHCFPLNAWCFPPEFAENLQVPKHDFQVDLEAEAMDGEERGVVVVKHWCLLVGWMRKTAEQ